MGVSKKLSKDYRLAVGKLNIKDYCEENFVREINQVNLSTVRVMAKELLNLEKKDGESDLEFFKRVANYIGWEIPTHLIQEKGK